MVRTLIEWAKAKGWEGIEAGSFEDIPIIYEITGSTRHSFWEKTEFRLIDRHPHQALQDHSQFNEFIKTLTEQVKSLGIMPERVCDRLVMRLDLT